jgi:glycosyltransferase involved in cell wall biosynthesis
VPAMNPTAYILVAYPFSSDFRKQILTVAGSESEFISVGELRGMGMRRMLNFLRSMRRDAVLYIPLEDPQSESIFPLLFALAALSSVRRITAIGPDCTVHPLRKIQAFGAILRVVHGTISGVIAALRCEIESTRLLSASRIGIATPKMGGKVLYINSNYSFGARVGGSVGHIAGVVNALSDMGYKIHLASAGPQPMIRPAVQQTTILGLATFGYPQDLNLLRFHFRVLKELNLFPGNEYQFLYQRTSLFNFTGVVLSRLWRVPLILEYNGSEVWVAQNWGTPLRFAKLGAAIEGVCLRHAHRVVVVSQALADDVIARGVDPARVVCYPNCVDPSHFSPEAVPVAAKEAIRNRYDISSEEVLIAFVGTFGKWHGAPVLASAIKVLVDDQSHWLRQHKVRFAMIGDGGTMPAVRELIGGSEYSRWVVFTGLVQQSETVKYLAACDVLVSPHVANADGSRFFGSPTKLFEYMAMAKGIIASDLDQIGEVLKDGIRIWAPEKSYGSNPTAILVRPGCTEDLVAGIRLLVNNPELRCDIGTRARDEIVQRYTWSHHVVRILDSLGRMHFNENDHAAAIAAPDAAAIP